MENKSHATSVVWTWTALLLVATGAILVGSYAYYHHEANRIQQEKYQELAAIAKLKVGEVRYWRQVRSEDAGAVAKGPLFNKAINEWRRNRVNEPAPKDLTDRLITAQRARGYVDAVLLNLDRHVLLSASGQPDPVNAAEEQAVQYAIDQRQSVLTDLFRTPHGAILITAVAPLPDPEGRPIALVLLRSDPESALYPLIESWPTPSETAETLLIRRDGAHVLSLNRLRHKPDSALRLQEPLTKSELPAVQAVLGKQGMFLGRDYRGVEVLADLRPVPNSSWFMVSKVDASEILAEAQYRGSVIAVFAGLFVLLAASGTAYSYHRRQALIYQNLYRSELEQREAQEQFRTILYSIADAVITTDTRGVVKQMSPVAETLTGWLESEAVGRAFGEIFPIINGQTRQPCPDSVEQALKHGQAAGLADHTTLIARDGRELTIDGSGACIRNKTSEIAGAVLVFREVTEKKKAEEETSKSQARLREAQALAHLGNWELDLVNNTLFWSDEIYNIFEIAPTEFDASYEAFVSFIHPDDREAVNKAYTDSLANKTPYEITHRLLFKDGRIKYVHEQCQTFYDEFGKPVRSVGTVQDVTDRRQAEIELRESEQRFRAIFENDHVVMLIVDPHTGLIEDASPAACSFYGYPREDLKKKTMFDISTSPPDVVWERMRKAKLQQRELFDLQHRLADGGLRDVEGSSGPVVVGGRTLLFAVFHDVTERKCIEADLKASELRYRLVVENSTDAIWTMDPFSGRFTFVSAAVERMFGYTPEEALALPLGDWLLPEWRPAAFDLLRQLRDEDREKVVYEAQVYHKNGGVVWCEIVASLWKDEKSGLTQIIGVSRDITQRKQSERKLAERVGRDADESKLFTWPSKDFRARIRAIVMDTSQAHVPPVGERLPVSTTVFGRFQPSSRSGLNSSP